MNNKILNNQRFNKIDITILYVNNCKNIVTNYKFNLNQR